MADPLIVALVSACPATVLSGLTLLVNRRQTQTIGKKNGKGTIVQMVEGLVEWKGLHTLEHRQIAAEEVTYRTNRAAHKIEHEDIATEEAEYRADVQTTQEG